MVRSFNNFNIRMIANEISLCKGNNRVFSTIQESGRRKIRKFFLCFRRLTKRIDHHSSSHVVAIAKIDADVVNGTNGNGNGNGGGGKPKAQQRDDGKGPGPQGPTLN